jgi:hypothetical protein
VPSIPPPDWGESQPASEQTSPPVPEPAAAPNPEPLPLEPIGAPAGLQQHRLAASQSRGRDAPNTVKGIEGERRVSEELAVALANTGAILINSLRFLHWGDVDHLIIGPGGITVVDAKNWSGDINVADGIPRVGTRKKHDKLAGLRRQQAGVRLALAAARPNLRTTNVQAVMCFADDPSRPVSRLEGGVVLAGSAATAAIGGRGGSLTPDDIQHLSATLRAEIPQIHRDQIDVFLSGPGQLPDSPDPRPRRRPNRTSPRRTPKRSPPRPASARSRRASRARRRADRELATLIAIFLVGGAYWLAHHASTARVSGLGVLNSWPAIVTFSAPTGATIELAVLRRGHPTRTTIVTATGTTQTWQPPLSWTHRARAFTVEACILDAARQCRAGTTAATSALRSGSKLHGWTLT